VSMRILFVGDTVGKPGLRLLADQLDRLIDRHRIDYCIANMENAADGLGITPEIASEFLALGLHCITTGNHVWDKRQIKDYIASEPRLLRPVNYPSDLPGSGVHVGETPAGIRVGVLNVMGRVFMPPVDDPFRAARAAVEDLRKLTPVIVVDMHAEATSEKMAMGWYLDGIVSAVVGTHTHIQTCDERVLPGGTAYITDVGMTGPYDSVIGMDKDAALTRFLEHMPVRLTSARGDPRLCAAVIDIDESSGRARSIARVCLDQRNEFNA
jgi:2',3'-cyclic-nucleotide 2'-phosphodiesterase